jgi:hypothetical protein
MQKRLVRVYLTGGSYVTITGLYEYHWQGFCVELSTSKAATIGKYIFTTSNVLYAEWDYERYE